MCGRLTKVLTVQCQKSDILDRRYAKGVGRDDEPLLEDLKDCECLNCCMSVCPKSFEMFE